MRDIDIVEDNIEDERIESLKLVDEFMNRAVNHYLFKVVIHIYNNLRTQKRELF